MKHLISVLCLIILIGCGGGSGGSSSGSLTDFSGLYTYSDDDCVGLTFAPTFTISQDANDSLTLALSTGDSFTGSAYSVDGTDGFEVNGIDCVFAYIDQSDLDTVSPTFPTVDMSLGDMGLLCLDNSSGGSCLATYH